MKKLILGLCLTALLSVVSNYGNAFAQTGSGDTVPKELLTNESTYWTISTVSGVNYVNTTSGPYSGTVTSGGGMLVKFKFLPNNRYQFQLYVQSNMYNTRLESWTEIEGTVTFTKDANGQDVFMTKAEKGVYRMYRNGVNTNRSVTADELKNQHSAAYLWQKTMLKDDAQNVYLLVVNLKDHPNADVKKAGSIDPSWVSKFHVPVKG